MLCAGVFLLSALNPALSSKLPAASRGQSGATTALGSWYQTVLSEESAYCLSPNLPNETYSLGTHTTLILSNLTPYIPPGPPGGCSSAPPRQGVVVQIVTSGSEQEVMFNAVNNTTSPSNLAFGETDLETTSIGILGSTLWLKLEEQSTQNSSGFTARVASCCGWNSGGTGTGDSGSTGDSTSGSGSTGCPVNSGGPTVTTVYVWDNVCYQKGYQTAYPHPDRAFYNIIKTQGWQWTGTNLEHIQLSSTLVGPFVGLPGAAIGMLVGAAIGGELATVLGSGSSGWITVAGALAGVVIGAIISIILGTVYFDEQATIWTLLNNAFWSNFGSTPLWFWALWLARGQIAAVQTLVFYYLSYLTYVRVGNTVQLDLSHYGSP